MLWYGQGSLSGIGITASIEDFTIERSIVLQSDASAAIAIASRRGLGKVRHIDVCQLWLQDKVRRGDINVVKVGTHEHVAYAITKCVSRRGMSKHMRSTNEHVTEGRHEPAPATECQ